ncbi:hypothetical protein [Bacillus sp. 179-C3.3 HS]|uniref:hypothetical protein n=1 Tax=Bacillus sp. 179-C3.3 HS TaxID=3232162 RepID=UPI00399FB8DA
MMSIPKHVELSQAVKACKHQAITIEDIAVYLEVPENDVPMLVRESNDLVIEGNVVMAKRAPHWPEIFIIVVFIGIFIVAGLMQ